MKLLLCILLLLLYAIAPGCGEEDPAARNFFTGEPQLPADEHSIASLMREIGEPPLYRYAKDSSAEIYRVSRFPAFEDCEVVRIAKQDDGFDVTYTRWGLVGERGEGTDEALLERTSRRIGADEMVAFELLFAELEFFKLPAAGGRSGLDGTTWILEAVMDGEYRVVSRWEPEEEPFIEACEWLLALGQSE